MKRIEEHLYEHKHVIKDGQVTTRYYAKFTTWDRRPLTVALGDDLNAARVKLDRLHKLNDAKVRVELDEEKELREALARQAVEKAQERRGLTFAEWGQKYFDDIVYPKDKENPDCETADGIKSKSTIYGQKSQFETLKDFFGNFALGDIKLSHVKEYRRMRSSQGMSFPTANRELSFLRFLLNQAAETDHGDEPILEAVPRIKLPSEKGRARKQTISDEEYGAILGEHGEIATARSYLLV
jgi:hypothetical protein